MRLPTYFLRRPPLDLSPARHAAFARLYEEAVRPGYDLTLAYTLTAPTI